MQPGGTLSGIAAANGVSVADLAAANGLDPAGFPDRGDVDRGWPGGGGGGGGAAPRGRRARRAGQAPRSGPGDTLSGLAAGAGTTTSGGMAAMNGLDPNGRAGRRHRAQAAGRRARPGARVRARTGRRRPGRRPRAVARASSAPATSSPSASQYGVSPSLAAAIAWQESGFNNAMVSSANARGVMQVMPGTWDYVQENLAQRQLDPNSATDNVHAGVMYLKRLLDDTGGDENAAIAGYYQGLASVRDRGMYDDTQQYVNNVQALRSRFGGG